MVTAKAAEIDRADVAAADAAEEFEVAGSETRGVGADRLPCWIRRAVRLVRDAHRRGGGCSDGVEGERGEAAAAC